MGRRRDITLLFLATALMTCRRDAGRVDPGSSIVAARAAPPARVERAGVPRIVEMPDLQPGNILSEKLYWSHLTVKLEVSIDEAGSVLAAQSVDSPENRLARELGDFMAERIQRARFAAPPGVSYPYTFELTVKSEGRQRSPRRR